MEGIASRESMTIYSCIRFNVTTFNLRKIIHKCLFEFIPVATSYQSIHYFVRNYASGIIDSIRWRLTRAKYARRLGHVYELGMHKLKFPFICGILNISFLFGEENPIDPFSLEVGSSLPCFFVIRLSNQH